MVEPSTENRGQKRSEMGEELPADKRACSSLEFKPSSSSASPQTLAGSSSLALETNEGDMETSSSSASASGRSEGDAEKDSPYGSCDSDNDGYHRYSSLREFQRRRSYGYSAKFNRILASLSDEVEPSEQLAALTELCEVLSFSTEDSISSMIADQLAPVLVKLAKHESSPDTMLLAIRAMTYLCDILPRSSGFLVRHDAVPALCQRLMVIEYLDVAEQCLQALEKISRDQPLACLQSGAIMAVLNYIDFFSTTVQRTALSTVVNICKKLPSECPSPFMEAVPRLCSLLQYEDRQLVEHVATCLIKIADRVKDSPDMLDQLCAYGLIHQAVNLVDMNGRTTVSQSIRTNVIELLAKLTSLSADAVKTLFELSIGGVLKDLLLNYDIAHGMPSPRSLDKNCIQVHEVLKLLNELLTSLGKNHKDQPSLTEEKVSVEAADILLNFGMDILPTLIQVVNSGANLFVCYGCLSVINKLVRFSSPGHLHELVKSTNIASFLAGVFTRSDPHILLLALQITQTVLQKLSDVLMDSFIKEGVLFAIDAILVPVKTSQLTFTMANGIHTSFDMGQKFSGRCMCYAYELVLTSDSGSCKVDKDVVHTLAEQVKADYFIAGLHNPQSIVTDILQNLKDAATELTDLVKISLGDDAIDDYEEKFHSVLHQFTIQLSGHEPISTFELMESGIIRALVNYFSNGQYLEEKIGISNALTHLYEVQKRFQTFARVSLSSPDPLSQELPLSLLVRKLQSALSTVENFPVILGNMVRLRGSYATVPNGSYTMHSCFRVRFLRGEDETSLSDYSGDVVSVDPFCSVEAIEKYLWPKVSKRSTEYSESAVQASRKPKVIPLEVAVGSSLQGKSSDPTGSDGICSILPEMQETMVHRSSGLSTEAVGSSQAQIDEAKLSNRAFPGCIERDLCLSSDGNADMKVDSNKLASTSSSSAALEKDGRRIPSCGAKNDGAKLSFYLEGTELDPSSSLYQQIIQQQMNSGQEFCSSAKLWSETYTLSYKMAANTDKCCSKYQSDICSSYKLVRHTPLVPVLDGTVAPRPFSGLEKSSPVNDVLFLLRSLEMMNRFMIHLLSHERLNAFAEGKTDSLDSLRVTVPALPQNNFVNSKLTEKLEQQLRDPLAVCVGAMPLWCNELMSLCPFLFSFEARCKFFHLAAFGRLHGQCHLSPHTASDVATERRLATGALPRKKFVVSRDRVLFSAAQMMDLHARQKVALEVEYNEEVGTGLGPTLEFYTLVCHEFQKADLGMWRLNHISSNNGNSVLLPFGLFPRPWSLTSSTSGGIEFSYVLKKFVLLGQIVGKALQDGRVLDLPFSKAFYKLILGKDLTIYDIQSFDPELGRALLEFQAIVDRQQYLKSTRGENCTFEVDATFRNTKIEDLCLDFTLPGYPDFVLASGLNYMTVNINNIKEYISLVLDATLYTGISRQVEAFKSGLSQVFPIKHLQIFTEEELERLLCGEHDSWASNELLDHIKFDHGYNSMSPPIINLLEIIREFDYNQRRAFLQFVTGAPRLPPGGLAALSPKLTIVRKHSGNGADADLPSVMTCANYLKLPPYSSKERMKEKLLYAITEGQGSFHLS